MNKALRNYLGKKALWFVITLFCAVLLNFILPRLMPGDPVSSIMAQLARGMTDAGAVKRVLDHYVEEFGINQPLHQQFFIYIGNVFRGEFGRSFVEYPRTVSNILANALPWTIGLQLPAILTGWIIGNILGAIAAYVRKGFDKVVLPTMLFVGSIPAFGMAIILLSIFAINLQWLPVGGGYPHTMLPSMSLRFFAAIIRHYHLPFWSIVLISIGGKPSACAPCPSTS